MRDMVKGLALVAALLGTTGQARAQGWFILPNGKHAYLLDYTTTGFFSCPGTTYIGAGTCTSNGTSVTIRNGSSAMTMSYSAVSRSHVAVLGQSTTMHFGRLTQSFSGTPFTPRVPFPLQADYFYFNLRLQSLAPDAQSATWYMRYLYDPRWFDAAINPVLSIGLDPARSPYGHTTLSFGELNAPNLAYTGDAAYDLFLSSSIAPEPATIALVATGLAGIAGAARRRRKTRAR